MTKWMMTSLLLVLIFLPSTVGLSSTKIFSSIGEAIQQSSHPEDLLNVASQLWLPSDPDLPAHLRTQSVHHEKRQRWSAQLLEKLSSCCSSSESALKLDDERLQRAVLAASLPFQGQTDRPTKEGRYIRQALLGLHTLIGTADDDHSRISLLEEGIHQLVHRADAMTPALPLAHVVEMRFAARGLLKRLSGNEDEGYKQQLMHMNKRVSKLPFDILPRGVNWDEILVSREQEPAGALYDAIPFRFDTITTRTGEVVVERRGTSWLAEPGIGALAYSGKLMAPQPVPDVVSKVMRAVEVQMDLPSSYFDCALCNHYPDAEAACKFHTDPEHGTFWERITCVVSAGDARRFAFRPIPGETRWSEWDTESTYTQLEETTAAAIQLFPGDVVQMWGKCNDAFHHAVYAANPQHDGVDMSPGSGRVSLVLKRAIDRGGGKRGHGLQGTGRRSKRGSSAESQTLPTKGNTIRKGRNKS